MIQNHEGGECSISLHKTLYFTLPSRKFTQKKNNLSACVFVPPSYVVAGTRSGTIYRWTIPEKIEDSYIFPNYEVTKHSGIIHTMHWSDSMKLLFTSGADRTILVWTMSSRVPPDAPIQTISSFEETPLSIVTYQNYLFVAEQRGISVFCQQSIKETIVFVFKSLGFFNEKASMYRSISFSPNPRVDNSGYLYAGLANGFIIQYDAHLSDLPVLSLSSSFKKISDNAIFNTVYFPRTESLFVFSYDNFVRIFNHRNYRVVNHIQNQFNDLFISACAEDDVTHLLCDRNGNVYVWEIQETARLVHQKQLSQHSLGLFPTNTKSFLYLQRDNITLISIHRGSVKTSYPIHNGTVFYINVVNDSSTSYIATTGDDRFLRFWDTTDFNMRLEHRCPTNTSVLSSYIGIRERHGSNVIWAVSGHDEGHLFFVNITDHKGAELPSRHKNSISSITVVQNEMKILLYACDYDGYISVWSIDSILENISYSAVSLIKMWKAHDQEILASSGIWMTGHCVIATGGNDRVIKIWKENDGIYNESSLVGHTDSVTALRYEGLFLFSGAEDFTIRIWDTVNLVQLFVISQLHTSAIREIVHIPEENMIASCDSSGVVNIYNYIKKTKIWSIKHSSDCRCIYVDKYNNILYACVRGELIPHSLPREASNTGLPLLNNSRAQQTRYERSQVFEN